MYQIKNQTANSCEILLYSLIHHGYTAMNIIDQLKGIKDVKEITLRINSDGGDVFEALAIYNYLKSLDAEITVYIDGLAASAATIVACSGKVIMPSNAQMMIHNPFGLVQGDSEEMRAMAEVLDKVKDSIISVYSAKTGQDKKVIAKLMDKETWLSSEEAFALGFCNEVLDEEAPEEEEDEDITPVVEQYLATIDERVKAERERIKELDGLMTPERKGIINRAKYETLQSAKDIALELLKIQARSEDNLELSGISPLTTVVEDETVKTVADMINAKRGYKR